MVDGLHGGPTPSLTNPDLGTWPAMANNTHVDVSSIWIGTGWTLRPRRASHQRSTTWPVTPPPSDMTWPRRIEMASHCPIPTQCRILPRTVALPQSDSDHQGPDQNLGTGTSGPARRVSRYTASAAGQRPDSYGPWMSRPLAGLRPASRPSLPLERRISSTKRSTNRDKAWHAPVPRVQERAD